MQGPGGGGSSRVTTDVCSVGGSETDAAARRVGLTRETLEAGKE